MAQREHQVIVDNRESRRETHDDVLELHRVGAGCRPFQANDIRYLQKLLDRREGNRRTGPEGVVDNDADLGGVRRCFHIIEEIAFGVTEIEGAGDLDVVEAEALSAFREADQLTRAGRLSDLGNGISEIGFRIEAVELGRLDDRSR
jgi:hypothetical protein